MRTIEGRREFFREAKAGLCDQDADGDQLQGERRGSGERKGEASEVSELAEARDTAPYGGEPGGGESAYVFDAERIVARDQGREGWLREARRQLEARRWEQPEPVPRSRAGKLLIAAERLEAELVNERRGNAAYEEYRARGRMKNGRRFGAPPKPYVPPALPEGKVNVSDPDSRYMKTTDGYVQGYNAQAVVTEQQIVLAAELTTRTSDWSQLEPMVSAAVGELDWAGVAGRPEVALADAQYWNEEHIDAVVAERHIQVLIPPESRTRDQPRPGWTGGRYDWMRAVLKGQLGDELYRKRVQMVEPVFGQTKHNRSVTRFHRRSRKAVRTEWRLVMATHNLMKLFRHQLATMGA